jgi:hypothetical protein
MRRLFSILLVAVFASAVLSAAFSQVAAEPEVEQAPAEASDQKACEEWKAAVIAEIEKQLESNNNAYREAQKSRITGQMKALLAKKKELTQSLKQANALTTAECWKGVLEERAQRLREKAEQESKVADAAKQTDRDKAARAVWESSDKAAAERAEKAAANRKLILRRREVLKDGRNILTRDELRETVKIGMNPVEVIEAIGEPDKTQESGDLRSFIYYKKTIDDLTGSDDDLAIVNFWMGKVDRISFR